VNPDFIAWALPLTALTTGFLGSVHCLGMCGGISATVALASPSAGRQSAEATPAYRISFVATSTHAGTLETKLPGAMQGARAAEANVLAFNTGRIASYALAGAMAGTVGGALAGLGQGWIISDTMALRTALFVLANLMIVFTGLYLIGIPQILAPLERAGGQLWKHISPWTRRFLPLRSPLHAAAFGALWGWIPCGMVYAMLVTAMSAGGTASGAMTMLAFGLGTLPAMLGAGWSAGRLRGWTRRPRVRFAAGIAVIALGAFGLARLGSLEQLQSFGAFCMTAMSPVVTGPVTP
jgi:sulfite exporter TauE/SafE